MSDFSCSTFSHHNDRLTLLGHLPHHVSSKSSLTVSLSPPLSVSELQLLNDELLTALRSGVSLDLGLRESANHLPGRMSFLADQLAGHLADGKGLEEALENLNPSPPTVYRVLVAAGIRGNQLEQVLTRLNEFARVVGDLRESLRRAIVYPIALGVVAFLLTVLATYFCVPPLREFMTNMKAVPSLPVKVVYALHDSLLWWGIGLPLVVGLACLVGLAFDWMQSGNAGAFGFLRYFPGFGRMMRNAELSRLANLLAIQTEYGLPLPESLRRCADAVADPQLSGFCMDAADRVERGESFGESLTHSHVVPPFMKWLLSVPGSQADLARSTRQAAELYRERTMLQAEWIARMVPAIMTLGFGATVVTLYSWAVIGSLISVWDGVM